MKIYKIFSIIILVCLGFVLFLTEKVFFYSDKSEPLPQQEIIVKEIEEVVVEEKIIKKVENPLFMVTRVIDGDTIDVSIDGKIERLRLIGINTPETVDPRKPVECFGVEASNRAKELLNGKLVSLESDPSQGERDKYNRLLRYVFLEDGTNFNLRMIEEGYAYEYTYNTPYKYQAQFKRAQIEAKNAGAGLWGDNCRTD